MNTKLTHISDIRVTTGYDCNCQCEYCTQRNTDIAHRNRGNGTQIETLYALLKQPHIIKEGTLSVELEGGEPLLHPEVIKDTVRLCEQMKTDKRDVRYIIVSNCQLLNGNGREIIDWMKEKGVDFQLSVSFDHDQKNPRIIRPDTYEYMKANHLYATYVVAGKHYLRRAKQNIDFLNEKGISPMVLWNFFAYNELKDISNRRAYLSLLTSTKNRAKNFRMFSGNIQDCAWAAITPQGRLYQCFQANFGDARLDEGEKFACTHCKTCELKDYCHQCVVRKAIYGDNLCGLMKVHYALDHNAEVT